MTRQLIHLLAVFLVAACSRGAIEFGQDSSGAGGDNAVNGSGAGASGNVVTATGSSSGTTTTNATSATAGNASSSASGGDPAPSTGSGGGKICDSFGDSCTTCVSKSCSEVWCGCAENSACVQLFSCYSMCQGNESCNQACSSAHPNGISDVLLVSGCAGTVCDASCTWGDQDFDDCDACIASDCKKELNLCLAEPTCLQLWGCLSQCPDLDLGCQKSCYDTFPTAVPLLQTLLQCSTKECQDDC